MAVPTGDRSTVAVPTGDRHRLVRRNTILLAFSQGLSAMTFPVLLIVGSVAAAEMTGHDSSVGVVNASYFVAAAAGAFAFGRAMDRFGRKPGLGVAYLLLAAAGGVCGLAIAAESFPLLLAGAVLFGVAFGGANLARAAVADMYEPAHRGRAVGTVLAAGTIGAVGSPFLVAFLRGWADGEALDPSVLPWAIVPAAAIAALACSLSLRPDPRDLAIASGPAAPVRARPAAPRPPAGAADPYGRARGRRRADGDGRGHGGHPDRAASSRDELDRGLDRHQPAHRRDVGVL
ncbi:MAG: MFS transporter, partial [Actinomycetota bacterium]